MSLNPVCFLNSKLGQMPPVRLRETDMQRQNEQLACAPQLSSGFGGSLAECSSSASPPSHLPTECGLSPLTLSRCSLAGDVLLARSPAERHCGEHLPLETLQPAGGGRVHPLLYQLLGQPFKEQDGQLLLGKWQWGFSLSLIFMLHC